MHIYLGILALLRLSGWEEIKINPCFNEGVNEESAWGGGLNFKISLIGSIFAVKNER